MRYIESEFAEAINIESAVSMGCDMVHTTRAFAQYGDLLVIDKADNLPEKYHKMLVDFDDLTQENKDKLTPQEEI